MGRAKEILAKLEEAGGSGFGKFKKGEVIKDPSSLEYEDILLHDGKQFNTKNVVKIIQVDKARKIAYGLYVDPKNTSKIRLSSDKNFAIWFSEFKDGEYFKAVQ